MNNRRLLIGLLTAASMSGGLHLHARTPVTLEELFSIAESNSAQLRPAFTAQKEADSQVGVALNGRLPEINASLSASYNGDGFTTDRHLKDYQRAPIPHFGNGLTLSVEQPVYTGGAVTAGIELARLQSSSARYATELQRDNLRFRLAGDYLDLYKCMNLRKVIDGNIAAAREVLGEMQARYEQGTALRNDITRYELLLSTFELQRIKLDNSIEILNRNIVVTAGMSDTVSIMPDSLMLSRALPVETEGRWLESAKSNSPQLRLARSGVEISRKAENLVRADRRPHIGIRAGWSFDGPILTEVPPINRNLSYWYVGVGVSYNLSSLFKTRRGLEKSKAATLLAADRLDATLEQVELNVRADHTRYLEAYEELNSCTKQVELADRNYNTTATRYSEGMALVTDLLDAANARLDAQQKLVNARIDIIYYYYKLLFTTGTI